VPNFEGDFETHVTVSCEDAEVEGLAAWAESKAVKLTHVVLARGRVRSQPMLTYTGSGTSDQQRTLSLILVSDLLESGYDVTRVKVEAAPWTSGVPHTDAEARALGPEYYFEHHIKLLCSTDSVDLADLAAQVEPHGAHLSWNARRVRDDGRAERFVTQRCHGVGDASAIAALSDLSAMLISDGREIVSAEREFVVFDSDASLDDGWIKG
jgi:hypothetical protein